MDSNQTDSGDVSRTALQLVSAVTDALHFDILRCVLLLLKCKADCLLSVARDLLGSGTRTVWFSRQRSWWFSIAHANE